MCAPSPVVIPPRIQRSRLATRPAPSGVNQGQSAKKRWSFPVRYVPRKNKPSGFLFIDERLSDIECRTLAID